MLSPSTMNAMALAQQRTDELHRAERAAPRGRRRRRLRLRLPLLHRGAGARAGRVATLKLDGRQATYPD
jgi:hypothetical protein